MCSDPFSSGPVFRGVCDMIKDNVINYISGKWGDTRDGSREKRKEKKMILELVNCMFSMKQH